MTSLSSTAFSTLPRASLTGMPQDTFSSASKFLTQSEVATVACVDRHANHKVSVVRSQVKHLDISFNENRIYRMCSSNLADALRLHPHFNSIDFSGYRLLSNTAGQALCKYLKTRDMKVITANGTNFEEVYPRRWAQILQVGLSVNTPNTLEHLHLDDVDEFELIPVIIQLASRCHRLKSITIPGTVVHGHKPGIRLLRALPPTMVFLGPNWAPITDEVATLMMSKFIPANIRGCNLTFENDQLSSLGKRSELLQFLPLESMTEITLAGTRDVTSVSMLLADRRKHLSISTGMIQHIASRISQNTELKILNLNVKMEYEDLTETVVLLINSIQSAKLEELVLPLPSKAIPDMTPILEAITAKLSSWPHIRTIQIGNLSSSNLLPHPYPEDITPSFIGNMITAQIQNNHMGFYSAEQELNTCSIHSILAHYVKRHNEANPANPMTPSQILREYKSHETNDNTNWTTLTSLVWVLEGGLNRTMQQQSAQIQQDDEDEPMLEEAASSNSVLATNQLEHKENS